MTAGRVLAISVFRSAHFQDGVMKYAHFNLHRSNNHMQPACMLFDQHLTGTLPAEIPEPKNQQLYLTVWLMSRKRHVYCLRHPASTSRDFWSLDIREELTGAIFRDHFESLNRSSSPATLTQHMSLCRKLVQRELPRNPIGLSASLRVPTIVNNNHASLQY